jgi:hypothetical protein
MVTANTQTTQQTPLPLQQEAWSGQPGRLGGFEMSKRIKQRGQMRGHARATTPTFIDFYSYFDKLCLYR